MSEAGAAAILERGAGAGYPPIGRSQGGAFALVDGGEGAWKLRIPALSPAELREVSHALDEAEDRERREAERQAHAAALSAPPDEALIAEQEAEARAAHERYIAERPARVERLLGRIAEAVEGLARR
jgi:hypothetical protein